LAEIHIGKEGEKHLKKEKKAEVVKAVAAKISDSGAIFITDYRGLNVAQISGVRRELRKAGAELKVVKNTLIRIAGKGTAIEKIDALFEGPTAVVFSKKDPVGAAKVVKKVNKETGFLSVKGGLLGKDVLSTSQVMELAEIAPKEELLAKLVGSLNSPISRLVGVLGGRTRSLVYTLDQVAKKKEAAAG
jgi:large subunit ribosomal protein L10